MLYKERCFSEKGRNDRKRHMYQMGQIVPKVGNSLPLQLQRSRAWFEPSFQYVARIYGLEWSWPPVASCFGVDGRKIAGTEVVIPDGRGRITGGPGAAPSGALVLVGSITRVVGPEPGAIAAPSGALVSIGSVTRAAGTGFTRFCADGESGEFGVSVFAGLSSFL